MIMFAPDYRGSCRLHEDISLSADGMTMLIEDLYNVQVLVVRVEEGDARAAALTPPAAGSLEIAAGRGQSLLEALDDLESRLDLIAGRF